MDQGDGMFKMFEAENEEMLNKIEKELQEQHPEHGGTFTVGEELEIRGSKFKIAKIMRNRMMLKLLPKWAQGNR